MGQKLDGPLPENLIVAAGWQFVWDAVDPTTGATVSGVVVTNKSVTAADGSGQGLNVGTPILLGLGL